MSTNIQMNSLTRSEVRQIVRDEIRTREWENFFWDNVTNHSRLRSVIEPLVVNQITDSIERNMKVNEKIEARVRQYTTTFIDNQIHYKIKEFEEECTRKLKQQINLNAENIKSYNTKVYEEAIQSIKPMCDKFIHDFVNQYLTQPKSSCLWGETLNYAKTLVDAHLESINTAIADGKKSIRSVREQVNRLERELIETKSSLTSTQNCLFFVSTLLIMNIGVSIYFFTK